MSAGCYFGWRQLLCKLMQACFFFAPISYPRCQMNACEPLAMCAGKEIPRWCKMKVKWEKWHHSNKKKTNNNSTAIERLASEATESYSAHKRPSQAQDNKQTKSHNMSQASCCEGFFSRTPPFFPAAMIEKELQILWYRFHRAAHWKARGRERVALRAFLGSTVGVHFMLTVSSHWLFQFNDDVRHSTSVRHFLFFVFIKMSDWTYAACFPFFFAFNLIFVF